MAGWYHGVGSVRGAERALSREGGTIPSGGASSRSDARFLHVRSGPKVTRHPPRWGGRLSPEAQLPAVRMGRNAHTEPALRTGTTTRGGPQAKNRSDAPNEKAEGHGARRA